MSGIRSNNGWLEAAIAWEVCASLHRQYCKGKDALFTTRQSDFVKHAEDAREYATHGQAPAGATPVRETERDAFKAAHRHLELDEVPDAWGRPMFKHSHVEASWLGWISRAAQPSPSPQAEDTQQAPAQAAPVDAIASILNEVMEIAVSNGANSVSMPDHYVEVAAWLAAAPTTQPAPNEDEGISREQWIEQAMRVYLIAGDTEQQAEECAKYLWGELDLDDLADPYDAAMSDVEGRCR